MDYGKAFSYPFQDSEWVKKILIGGLMYLISFLVVPMFFPMGYMVQTIKNVATGAEPVLPQWDDWGGYFTKGLMAFLIALIYSLPALVVMAAVVIVTTVLTGGASAASSESVTNAAGGISMICSCGGWALYVIFLIAACLIMPVAIMKYAVTGEFGAAFRFGQLFGMIKKNIGAYVVVLLLSWVAGLIGGLGEIACLIGVAFTMFYAMLVMAHLYGQYYRFVEGSPTTKPDTPAETTAGT